MKSLRKALHLGTADGTPKSSRSHADSGVSPSSAKALPRGMPSVKWELLGVQQNYHLNVLEKPRIHSTAFRSINGQTLAALIQCLGWEGFTAKYILVDCRYPYEYNGGHIKCAVNVHDKGELTSHFFPVHNRIPIFHCEFSHKRGPDMAYALRRYDRNLNKHRYPDVHYKEIYLLEGGYKGFFEEFRGHGLCEPSAYVTMLSDPVQLARYKNHLKRSQQAVPKSRLGTVAHKIKRLGAARRLSFSGLRSPVAANNVTPTTPAASRKRSSTRRSHKDTPSGTKSFMRPLTHWYPGTKHARDSKADRKQTPIAFRKRLPDDDHDKTPVGALKRRISKPIVQFPASSDEEEEPYDTNANPLPAMCRLSFD
ncbi:CDC25 protein [Aphelenchoides avenae]|nr:CDC25 protein [Aphelenchus avenae]